MPELDAKKVQYWIDRSEIRDVVNRYARGLDRHDDAVLESVFHPDAVDHHGPWVGPRDEFVRWANHECHNAFGAHTHNMTSHNCEIDGDTAHTETYVIFVLRERATNNVRVGGGRYMDRLEKRNGEWRIVVRRLIMDWRFIADGSVWQKPDSYEHGTWDKSDASYDRPLNLRAADLARMKKAAAPAGA
jgi:hypothetical protein